MKTVKFAVSKNALTKDGIVYKVLAVKNCTHPVPGEVLEKPAVDMLCASNAWEVTIVGANS